MGKLNKVKEYAAQVKKKWVRLTRACNMNCVFCLDKDNQDGTHELFSDIVNQLKSGRKEGSARVILSGGEPTIHPKIFEIIKISKKLGYHHAQIVSNGRMLSSKIFVKNLMDAGLDEVTLSLHSHEEEKFDAISKIKGSYKQSMKGLINVLNSKMIVSVDIVICQINYRTLKKTMLFFIRMGVSEFDLLHLIPFGNAWKNREDIYYSLADAKPYLDEVFELITKNKNLYIWTNRLPANYLEGYEGLIQSPAKLKDEVNGMKKDLKVYIETGKKLGCYGERCQFCFMQNFCKDIIKLKENKILKAKSERGCLSPKGEQREVIFHFRKNMNVYKFLDFFIEYRYYVKSLRCQKCSSVEICDGAQINKIRNKGFEILQPI